VYWLGVVCVDDYENISDCMLKSFGSSLPFCLFVCSVCCSSTFAMIIKLLMGTDVRGTCGQQGRDDSAA